MENLREINCKEIFRKAYENRYTWKNDFNGYQGKCTFTNKNNIHEGRFLLGKDFKPNIQKIDNEQTNSQEEIKKEYFAIKPQIIKNDSVKKIEGNNEITKDFDISQQNLTQQDLNRPLNFSKPNTDFQLERTVDEFDFDESAFLEA